MVDPRDLGLVAQVRSPHAEQPTIYLYEAVPGGVGLSERLWDRHDELLVGGGRAHRGVRLRRRLSGLHRARGSSPTSMPGRSPSGCSPSSGRDRAGRARCPAAG